MAGNAQKPCEHHISQTN